MAKNEIVYVTPDKLKRAQDIVAIMNRDPKSDEEREQNQKYGALMNAAGVKIDGKDAVQFVYEKILGGLVRTQQEQKVANAKKEEIRKKRKIEL